MHAIVVIHRMHVSPPFGHFPTTKFARSHFSYEKCKVTLLRDVKDNVKCIDVKCDTLPTRTQFAVHISLTKLKQSVELSCIPGKN